MKDQRWWNRVDNLIFIYDSPFPENARTVSIVTQPDLMYYRQNFHLRQIW